MSLPRCACGTVMREFVANVSPSPASTSASLTVRRFISCPQRCSIQWIENNHHLRATSHISSTSSASNLLPHRRTFTMFAPNMAQENPHLDTMHQQSSSSGLFLSPKKQRKTSIKKEKIGDSEDSIVLDLTGNVVTDPPTISTTSSATKTQKRLLKKTSSDESSSSESTLPPTIPIDLSDMELPITTKTSRKKKDINTNDNNKNSNNNNISINKKQIQPPAITWSYTSDPLLASLRETLFVFTDGSCPKNNNVSARFENPAGWGYVAVRPTHGLLQHLHETHRLEMPETRAALLRSDSEALSQFVKEYLKDNISGECVDRGFGPVFLATNVSVRHVTLGASVGSNNTGELSAFLEAFLYLLNHCPLLFNNSTIKRMTSNNEGERGVKRVVLCYDSEYAAKSIMGQFNGKKNLELVQLGRKLFQELQTKLTEFNQSQVMSPSTTSSGPSLPMSNLLDQHLSLNMMRKSYKASMYSNSNNKSGNTHSNSDVDGPGTGPLLVMAHVRAHSNHYWNDMADTLAERGAEGSLLKSARFQVETNRSLGQFLLVNDDSCIV